MFSPPVAYWREQYFRSSERVRQTLAMARATMAMAMAVAAVRAFYGERVC
jgi:hypothetical protein